MDPFIYALHTLWSQKTDQQSKDILSSYNRYAGALSYFLLKQKKKCTNIILRLKLNTGVYLIMCVFLCNIFWVSVQFRPVVAGVWKRSRLFTALSYSDHSIEKQERNLLKSFKPSKNFGGGGQFTFRAYLRFYSKCKFAYTKYAQNIVLLSD